MGINMLDMKQTNAQTVLWTLCSCRTSTIKDMTQMTGLSFATVGNILSSFVESGEVILGEMHSTTGGRPSQAYSFNAEYAHVLALSARVQNEKNIITACVGNLYGEQVWQTEQFFDTVQLTSFEALIEASLSLYPTIKILSFSLPGVARNGVIIMNDYKALEGVLFSNHFQMKYHIPVLIENDVNAAVFGYGRNKKSMSVIVGIYFPKNFGPGSGIMIDGKILKGASGFAGEVNLLPLGIDWMSLNYDNPQEIGSAITKLISVFEGTINPNHVVLYGDFFTDSTKEAIGQEISSKDMQDIFPTIDYQSDLNADIITGSITQAVAAYQTGLSVK
jgi:hypothetical protein